MPVEASLLCAQVFTSVRQRMGRSATIVAPRSLGRGAAVARIARPLQPTGLVTANTHSSGGYYRNASASFNELDLVAVRIFDECDDRSAVFHRPRLTRDLAAGSTNLF